MKILLLEDRLERQRQYLEPIGINLSNYEYVDVQTTLSDLLKLEDYAVFIIHQSAINESNKKILLNIKSQSKPIVIFSGGIYTTYRNIIGKSEHLYLNSRILYSENLHLFLNEIGNKNINLLLLAYGKKWEFNNILNVLEKVNTYINKGNKETPVNYEDFNEDTYINTVLSTGSHTKYTEQKNISITDIENIRKEIEEAINIKLEIV